MIYGYARVSTRNQAENGNSLEAQKQQLISAGAEKTYFDVYTGKNMHRPELDKLLDIVQSEDTIIVTKLDRFARSMYEASQLISELLDKGVVVNVLNLGVLDNSPSSRLMQQMLLAFAEFERNLILERTQEGKEIARQNPEYKEGRPRTYTKHQLDHAMELLEYNSYSEVARKTGISKSTLYREKCRRRDSAD